MIDVYPYGRDNQIGDTRMSGFGYPNLDFVDYVRAVTRSKPASMPFWVILQTHQFGASLREPTVAEVRLEQWLALGEGAKGIFWFIYSSQQGWRGLVHNQPLYDEVATQSRRLAALRETLVDLHKGEDQFFVDQNAYVSTLASADEAKHYVVVVNKDCENLRQIHVSSQLGGRLTDIETGQAYVLGQAIGLGPGEGRLLRHEY